MFKSRWMVIVGIAVIAVFGLAVIAGPLANVALANAPGNTLLDMPAVSHGVGPLGTVAETLDMSVKELLYVLFTRYDSIADVADARQTDPDMVVQALVDNAADHLSYADHLTPEQTAWILAQVEHKATAFVYVEFPYGAAIDFLQPAADTIGISVDELVNELQDDKTVADVAEAHDVDPADVEQAIIDHRAEIFDEAVDVGLLTETQSDILLDLYGSKVPEIVDNGLPIGKIRKILAGHCSLRRPHR